MSKINILALPNVKISGVGIDIVNLTTATPASIIKNIDKLYDNYKSPRPLDLIVDKSSCIPRITINDPVNQYFNGKQGDIYRIVDDSATRFRMVSGISAPSKTKTSPYHDATVRMYSSAYNTVVDMLKDRRRESELDEDPEMDDFKRKFPKDVKDVADIKTEELKIEGIKNRRGQFMYVYFLASTDESLVVSRKRGGGSKQNFKTVVLNYIQAAISHYNDKIADIRHGHPKITTLAVNEDKGIAQFQENIELILIYNNQNNEALVKYELPVQYFSIQQTVFNVTKHIDQPIFYLLDPIKDRKEILDILSLNGLVLERDKPLSEYNIKEGTKMLLI